MTRLTKQLRTQQLDQQLHLRKLLRLIVDSYMKPVTLQQIQDDNALLFSNFILTHDTIKDQLDSMTANDEIVNLNVGRKLHFIGGNSMMGAERLTMRRATLRPTVGVNETKPTAFKTLLAWRDVQINVDEKAGVLHIELPKGTIEIKR